MCIACHSVCVGGVRVGVRTFDNTRFSFASEDVSTHAACRFPFVFTFGPRGSASCPIVTLPCAKIYCRFKGLKQNQTSWPGTQRKTQKVIGTSESNDAVDSGTHCSESL